jgi:hypothetical protein
MENNGNTDASYWDLLERSTQALDQGDYPLAEQLFHQANEVREQSPGRVFLSEKVTDGLFAVWRKARAGKAKGESDPGRWARRSRAFLDEFLSRADQIVREGIRLSELRPEDDADANQPVLESALYLVSRSRLFREEPSSAVPLLKGLFRTARRTARPFDVQLVRHDIPLTEEDRLWLARRGGELLEAFVDQGKLEPGSRQAEEWAAVFLQLLQARYFGSTSRLDEERSWLEAVTADRFLGRGASAVALYRTYLEGNPEPGPRADEARVRLLEMLGNTDGIHFPIPLYPEALGAMQSAGLSAGSLVAGRYEAALARIEYRRPDPGPDSGQSLAWSTLSLEPDGSVAVVFWWGAEARDVGFWKPGADSALLDEFLAPCQGRLLPADAGVLAVLGEAWEGDTVCWTARDFATALLGGAPSGTGLEDSPYVEIALGESGPWRSGWKPAEGHPLLEPPRSSAILESWQGGPASGALLAGLVWLGIQSRIVRSDPCLRAGIGELARRGDGAAGFLYDFLILDQDSTRAVDQSFAPWTLPLLWTRPDLFTRFRGGTSAGSPLRSETTALPDLRRNDLAIVSTGNPGAVLAAWNDDRSKWRIVLDRPDRLNVLAGLDANVIGPSTLLPADGRVHSLADSLELLESMLGFHDRPTGSVDGLLPVFHWCRLVETHNGDLLDFQALEPVAIDEVPLFKRYAEILTDIPRQEPSLDDTTARGSWAEQFGQRVRKSGLVVGAADLLSGDTHRLDSLWGVFEGSDVSWVWLDSAAIHTRLRNPDDKAITDLHAVLHQRGRRHLSLLTGAIWHRREVENWLSSRLAVYGDSYCLALTDSRVPALRLAVGGCIPESTFHPELALQSSVARIDSAFATAGVGAGAGAGAGAILVPEQGLTAEFWSGVAEGSIPLAREGWIFLGRSEVGGHRPDLGARVARSRDLIVPVLASLEDWNWPGAEEDTPDAWRQADRDRRIARDRLRQSCSLEVAGLLAGPWDAVEILDTRWTRLFSGGARSESGGSSASAGGEGWRTFDLPGGKPSGSGPIPERISGLISDWCASRSTTPTESWMLPGSIPMEAPKPAGIHLSDDDLETIWNGLQTKLIGSWEVRDPGSRVLLVSERVPEAASRLSAHIGGAGISVWPPDEEGLVPGPILWCRVADFLDPTLWTVLEATPPQTIVAADLIDWLPGPDDESLGGASALRRILDCGSASVILLGRDVSRPWLRYLADVGGAILDHGEPRVPEAAFADREGPHCLECGEAEVPAAVIARLRSLLARLRSILAAGPHLMPEFEEPAAAPATPNDDRLLSVDWLGRMAGLRASDLAEGIRLLRWAARLGGDPLSASGTDSPADHAVLITHRFAVLENIVARMQEQVRILLPLWLGACRRGVPVWIDLQAPPIHMPEAELVLLDQLLLAVGNPGVDQWSGLTYHCPAGVIHSSRRILRCDEPLDAVLDRLSGRIQLFSTRLADVMSSAVETGDGFLVETGLLDLRAEESDFLALGAALGFWTWHGPAFSGAVSVVDLLTLADSRTAHGSGPAWNLYGELVEPRLRDPEDTGRGPNLDSERSTGFKKRMVGNLRSLLPEGEGEQDLPQAADRVGALLASPEGNSLLVLRGLVGSGRHEAVIGALAKHRRSGIDPCEITVFCPDSAVAAGFAREAHRLGLGGPLDIRIPTGSLRAGSTSGLGFGLADPSLSVIVLCEMQRFEAEIRYQISQLGRGRRLIMTVDPAATSESWEHLFLTTPRAEDVVALEGQTRVCRSLWPGVRDLVPGPLQGRPGSSNRIKGSLVSDYSANLDHCLSRIYQEHEEGRLPDRIRLTGSLAGDLDYLGSRFRDRGWLSVADKSLDLLVQPGPCEFLAAATDVLAASGELTRAFGAGLEDAPHLVPALLGPAAASSAARWLDAGDLPDKESTLNEFLESIQAMDWVGSFLAHPESDRRLTQLLESWGEFTVAGLLEMPLWEAWWYTLLDDLGLPGPERRRPVVALAATARPAGTWSPGSVYLCLGTEPASQHYQVLGRVTEGSLILYQEQSPLSGATGQ